MCVEDHTLRKMNPWKTSGQKQLETKTRRENDIWTSGGSGDYIAKSFTIKGREQDETKSKRSSEVTSPCPGAAWGWPAPGACVVPSGAVSCPLPSRNFSYLIKMTKISEGKFNTHFFLPKLLLIRKRTLQIPEFDP